MKNKKIKIFLFLLALLSGCTGALIGNQFRIEDKKEGIEKSFLDK